jgi:SAM-dependent methyltransferase
MTPSPFIAGTGSAPPTQAIGRWIGRCSVCSRDGYLPALGPVADVGCGAGDVTRTLNDLGVQTFGVDLSPQMVALARRRYPDLRFEVGSMLALDVPDGSLGGELASYSIIHVPWERRGAVFAEFRRVLAPGGQVMLVFQVGDEHRRRDEVDGVAISLDWYRQQPDEVADLLAASGFQVRVRAVRAAVRRGVQRARDRGLSIVGAWLDVGVDATPCPRRASSAAGRRGG